MRELIELFPEGQSIDSFNFSDVHKLVLNIFPLTIEKMLLKQSWRRQIDFPDAWGRTPLHWAVRRSDALAVETLLWAGANVDTQDREKWAPVHRAAWLPDPACLLLLLKSNANATVKNFEGAEPIHAAVLSGIPHLQALLAAGSSLEAEDHKGARPLNWTAVANNVAVGQFLVGKGADKNHADHKFGNSPLFSAISSLHCEFLDMLLDLEVNILHVNLTGSTVLHWIARWGDCRVVKIFAARKQLLRSLDIDQKDEAGRNAREVLYNRLSRPDGLDEEFERLVSSLEELQAGVGPASKKLGQNGNHSGILRVLDIKSAMHLGYHDLLFALMVAFLLGLGRLFVQA